MNKFVKTKEITHPVGRVVPTDDVVTLKLQPWVTEKREGPEEHTPCYPHLPAVILRHLGRQEAAVHLDQLVVSAPGSVTSGVDTNAGPGANGP